jgi:hypothetical protein
MSGAGLTGTVGTAREREQRDGGGLPPPGGPAPGTGTGDPGQPLTRLLVASLVDPDPDKNWKIIQLKNKSIFIKIFILFIPCRTTKLQEKPSAIKKISSNLKGLSHEIDFKNFNKKLHNLA